MESKGNIFDNNIKDNKIVPFNNDSTNPNFISGKINNIDNHNQELTVFCALSGKEKEEERTIKKEVDNNKKIEDLLIKDFINEMTLINSIPKQNLSEKRVIMENLIQKKEEQFKEKEQEDLFPYNDKEEENDDNAIEYLNLKDEIQNIKKKTVEKINKKSVNFKSEENEEKNNDYEKVKENIKITYNNNRTFSYNIKDINNNGGLNINDISSFFNLTSKHLKEELWYDHFFHLDYNNSHNYIPKLSLELNCNKNNNNTNGDRNIISKNNEDIQNNNINLNSNPKIFFLMYEQMYDFKNNSKTNSENISNDEHINNNELNELNIINNHDTIFYNNKNENQINISEESKKEGKIKSDNEKINNMQPFVLKNNFKNLSDNQYNQSRKIFKNKFPNGNKNINFNINNQRNGNNIFNNNPPNTNKKNKNNFKRNGEDIHHYNNISKYSNHQSLSNEDENNNKLNGNINQKNFMFSKSFHNDNNHLKYSIPKNTNNTNNIGGNINLYNINYNNNYIKLINPIIKNQNPKKYENINSDENEINYQLNSVPNNNHIKNLKTDDYTIQMFDRFGWICSLCNNFNFETRIKCNRCHKRKNPKMKKEIFNNKDKNIIQKRKIRKLDWFCLNCQNVNYGFRDNCNKCKIEKKEYFPTIYFDPNMEINDSNIKLQLIKIFGKMKTSLNNNDINDNAKNLQ